MAYCENCGAQIAEGASFCGECGARVEAKSQYNRGPEPQPTWDPNANPAPAQPVNPAQQPAWMQYAQPQAQPAWNQNNGATFVVPKKRLGKGGGIVMIIFGAILIFSFVCGMIGMLANGAGSSGSSSTSGMIGAIVSLILTCFGGGALLLAFGIRKIVLVNRYNNSLGM